MDETKEEEGEEEQEWKCHYQDLIHDINDETGLLPRCTSLVCTSHHLTPQLKQTLSVWSLDTCSFQSGETEIDRQLDRERQRRKEIDTGNHKEAVYNVQRKRRDSDFIMMNVEPKYETVQYHQKHGSRHM